MMFVDVFRDVPDPRDFTAQHDLVEVLFVALAAVLCGAAHCTEMAVFAKSRLDLLRRFVPLEKGAPSHDTFTRVFDLKAVARVESWRTLNGKTTHTVRTFALSRRMPPDQVLRLVRRHWAIENQLHWQLDVFMQEDQTRTRKNNGPHNLTILRRLALNVLRAEPQSIPLSHKRLQARWNDDNLINLVTHVR